MLYVVLIVMVILLGSWLVWAARKLQAVVPHFRGGPSGVKVPRWAGTPTIPGRLQHGTAWPGLCDHVVQQFVLQYPDARLGCPQRLPRGQDSRPRFLSGRQLVLRRPRPDNKRPSQGGNEATSPNKLAMASKNASDATITRAPGWVERATRIELA